MVVEELVQVLDGATKLMVDLFVVQEVQAASIMMETFCLVIASVEQCLPGRLPGYERSGPSERLGCSKCRCESGFYL